MSKTALVTGSSRGIGKACALKLAELGYDIAVNCNSNLEMAQKTVDEITSLGRKAVAYKANTADIDEVKDMFCTEYGRSGYGAVWQNRCACQQRRCG